MKLGTETPAPRVEDVTDQLNVTMSGNKATQGPSNSDGCSRRQASLISGL